MTRSRRAGLPRDIARQQPLYARILGLQYLAPSGFLCFVFLEGAVALGVLLALAELVSWWGVLVLPLTVAAMVKLNDVVAGALIRTPRAAPAGRAAAAASADAVGASGSVSPSGGESGGSGREVGGFGRGLGASRFGFGASASGSGLGASGSGLGASGSGVGAETVRLPAGLISQVGGPIVEPPPALRPATARQSAADTVVQELRDDDTWRGQTGALDASALNGPPTARQWNEELDDHHQRARQSAARRYE